MTTSLDKQLISLKKDELLSVVKTLTLRFGNEGEKILQEAIEQVLSKESDPSSENTEDIQTKEIKKKDNKKKEFDFSKCRKRHIALQIQYDGSRYYGFAAQEGQETVEKYLFEVLLKLKLIEDPKTCNYSRCGRTDRGVSAFGQIVAMHLRSALPLEMEESQIPRHPCARTEILVPDTKPSSTTTSSTTSTTMIKKSVQEMDYCSMINNLLPIPIRIIGWSEVTPLFSSRFSATFRTYRYFFLKKTLSIENMQRGANFLLGKHDFRNFCKLDIANVSNFEREIFSAEIVLFHAHDTNDEESVYMLEISGIAFLWHMIRCIMTILFLIGEGKEVPEVIPALLDITKYPGKPSYPMAMDLPLVLYHCGFDRLHIASSPKTLWLLTGHYQALYEEHILSAMRALNALQTIKTRYTIRRQDLNEYVALFLDVLKKKQSSVAVIPSSTNNISAASSSAPTKRKFEDMDTNRPSKAEEAVEEEVVLEEEEEEMVWEKAMILFQSLTGIQDPNESTAHYVPLLQRKKEETYEERLQLLSGIKKKQYDKHAGTHHPPVAVETPIQPIESITEGFFGRMRQEGSIV